MNELCNLRYSRILKIAGFLLILEGVLMTVPLIFSLFEGGNDWKAFLVSALITLFCGCIPVLIFRFEETRIYRREGYLLISGIWILFSLFGMLPFMLSEAPLSLTDAFFETISGFTTTGATVMGDVEQESRAILLWRSEIQWIGGLGIVLFLIAILPTLNDSGGISLFNAEITGITHDKLHPRIRQTALSLWGVYGIITLTMIPLLMLGGMSLFDSVCQSMTTVSTGGFSTRNGSIAAWGSSYIAAVTSVFMLLGGMNFTLLYNAVHGEWKALIRNHVFVSYLLIVLSTTAIISVCLYTAGETGGDHLIVAPLFQIASAITSTGFTYSDFALWGSLPLILIIMLMVCGACAGSTTGGVKIDRIMVMLGNLKNEIVHTLFPNHIERVSFDGKTFRENDLVRILAFLTVYILTLSAGALLMSAYGYNLTDSIFSSASCMGNTGLGYGATGSSYGALPSTVKWMFSLEMLLGRLEIFSVLVLFYRRFWK